MKPIANWDEIPAEAEGMRSKLQPGGYVVKITGITNDPKKEYLKVVYDIAEGPEAGRYSDDWGTNSEHDYAHSFYRSYKEKALGMFKGFIQTVEASNPGYTWDWHEDKLPGKLIGIVLGLEEYMSNRGEIATRLTVRSVITPEKIRAGEYVVPDIKKYKPKDGEAAVAYSSAAPISSPDGFVEDPDIPF